MLDLAGILTRVWLFPPLPWMPTLPLPRGVLATVMMTLLLQGRVVQDTQSSMTSARSLGQPVH